MGLQLAYIGLTLLMIIIIIRIGFKAINGAFGNSPKAKLKKRILVLSLVLWQVYVYLISISGILQNLDFPPRFFLFLILPLFIFTGVFIYRNRNNGWIQHIPPSWLFWLQSFRILVETIFVASVAEGILHKEVTIEGYNFDMIYAYTIPIIAFLVFQKKILPINFAILWNYLGLAIIASIIFVFISSIYLPEMYGASEPLMPLVAATYPYTLVAGFLMPSAVFMHILNIVQLKRKT